MGKLVIRGVDLSLLERQRLWLGELLDTLKGTEEPVDVWGERLAALEGVVGMLDTWSDRRALMEPQKPLQAIAMCSRCEAMLAPTRMLVKDGEFLCAGCAMGR